jgi:hypothetical protein
MGSINKFLRINSFIETVLSFPDFSFEDKFAFDIGHLLRNLFKNCNYNVPPDILSIAVK